MDMADDKKKWGQKADREATAVADGIKMVMYSISNTTTDDALGKNFIAIPANEKLKAVVISTGGNGASLLKAVEHLINNEKYFNFQIYCSLNYFGETSLLEDATYIYFQNLLKTVIEKGETVFRVFRYIPHRETEAENETKAMELADQASNTTLIRATALPLDDTKNGCVIFDGVTGTGIRPSTPKTASKLEASSQLIRQMAKVKRDAQQRVFMVCNDIPSGMDQYGNWTIKLVDAEKADPEAQFEVDYVLSMHWNKPFVNSQTTQVANSKIILLKYSSHGNLNFFEAIAEMIKMKVYQVQSKQLNPTPPINLTLSLELLASLAFLLDFEERTRNAFQMLKRTRLQDLYFTDQNTKSKGISTLVLSVFAHNNFITI